LEANAAAERQLARANTAAAPAQQRKRAAEAEEAKPQECFEDGVPLVGWGEEEEEWESRHRPPKLLKNEATKAQRAAASAAEMEEGAAAVEAQKKRVEDAEVHQVEENEEVILKAEKELAETVAAARRPASGGEGRRTGEMLDSEEESEEDGSLSDRMATRALEVLLVEAEQLAQLLPEQQAVTLLTAIERGTSPLAHAIRSRMQTPDRMHRDSNAGGVVQDERESLSVPVLDVDRAHVVNNITECSVEWGEARERRRQQQRMFINNEMLKFKDNFQ
jgi:hypothetical protein